MFKFDYASESLGFIVQSWIYCDHDHQVPSPSPGRAGRPKFDLANCDTLRQAVTRAKQNPIQNVELRAKRGETVSALKWFAAYSAAKIPSPSPGRTGRPIHLANFDTAGCDPKHFPNLKRSYNIVYLNSYIWIIDIYVCVCVQLKFICKMI